MRGKENQPESEVAKIQNLLGRKKVVVFPINPGMSREEYEQAKRAAAQVGSDPKGGSLKNAH